MIIKTFQPALLLGALLLTAACNPLKSDDLASICKEHPELCADLQQIGDCRYKRTTVIRARYYEKIEPSEIHTRDLLNELDEYQSCMELTLSMQFTRNKERKQHRLDNYLQAQKLMNELLIETKGTQDPHLAYYLWTRHQDYEAKEVFLKAANQKGITDIRLLMKLANFNAKEDPQGALNLFYKALNVSNSIEDIPKSAFLSIMTLYFQNKNFEQAYVWALLAEEQDDNDEFPINLDLILRKGLAKGKKVIANEDELEDMADLYYQQLADGTFTEQAPKLKK
ncbi:DUF2989 domain-containing protein [Psychromonas aquimarina]|uniref:DUF2989 domain-containing protein n=1 Tax=Psychromonas aquimarina TaxID=444919 RepID=UPI000423BD79|nr:DUF2989 domain-containing protein [Psychromonas aquimarina]